jgi:hypothetical protein
MPNQTPYEADKAAINAFPSKGEDIFVVADDEHGKPYVARSSSKAFVSTVLRKVPPGARVYQRLGVNRYKALA